MKHFKYLLLILAMISVAAATPSRAVQTTNSFFGANGKQFAIIRTLHDNLGNYYNSEAKIYLDEFSKETGQRVKSTLLVTSFTSVNVDDYKDVKTKTVAKDKTLKLADVMATYNVTLAPQREPEWAKRLTWTLEGIRLDNSPHVQLVAPQKTKTFIQEKEPDGTFLHRIAQVSSHQGALYLTLSSKYEPDDDADGIISEVVYVPAAQTKRLFAWLDKKESYMQAASMKTQEAATQYALALEKKARANNLYGLTFEVWSKQLKDDKLTYVVLLTYSGLRIQQSKVPAINKALDTKLINIKSDQLRDRFPLMPSQNSPAK